jgi:hypothetical protein
MTNSIIWIKKIRMIKFDTECSKGIPLHHFIIVLILGSLFEHKGVSMQFSIFLYATVFLFCQCHYSIRVNLLQWKNNGKSQ